MLEKLLEQIDDDNEEEYVKAIGAVSNCRRRRPRRSSHGRRQGSAAGWRHGSRSATRGG